MSEIKFTFDMEKGVEVIVYLANHIPQPTFMSIMKLMYFADKTNLESYGRFICGGTYVAMEHGPVPSALYDLVKNADNMNHNGFIVEHGHHIKPLRDANLEELSESDIDTLDRTIEAYGKLPAWQLRQMSHDEDAYKAAWENRSGEKGSVPISIEEIVKTLDNADELLDYLEHRHDD